MVLRGTYQKARVVKISYSTFRRLYTIARAPGSAWAKWRSYISGPRARPTRCRTKGGGSVCIQVAYLPFSFPSLDHLNIMCITCPTVMQWSTRQVLHPLRPSSTFVFSGFPCFRQILDSPSNFPHFLVDWDDSASLIFLNYF